MLWPFASCIVLSPWQARQSVCAASRWGIASRNNSARRTKVTAQCRRTVWNKLKNHSTGPTTRAIKYDAIRAALVMRPYLPPWCACNCICAHGFPAADFSACSENSDGDCTFEETLFPEPLAVIVVTTEGLMRCVNRFLSVMRATSRWALNRDQVQGSRWDSRSENCARDTDRRRWNRGTIEVCPVPRSLLSPMPS